jgi:monovalent cation:H+ antiporter, CPA1 family
MGTYTTIAILVFLAALFAYINGKFLKLAPTIGLMLQAFVVSIILIGLSFAGVPGLGAEKALVSGVNFNQVVFGGVLSFLLFAGALQICLSCVIQVRAQVLVLATVGVILSTAIVGFAAHYMLRAIGLNVPLGQTLLFGALISPTDPVAILPIMRRAKVSTHVEGVLEGESLFNDGVAIVVFTLLLNLETGSNSLPLPAEGAILFAREALGGLAFGVASGYVAFWLIKTIDDYPVEILITLALVAAGYAAAQALGTSGPLAMVTAGIIIGNHARPRVMSTRSAENLDRFWELIDIILNAVLFVLIGLEVVALAGSFSFVRFLASLAAIIIVLVARFVSIGVPLTAFRSVSGVGYRSVPLLTWAGLRGAIPVALALSLPASEHRDLLVTMTYVVVVFSVLVQATTVHLTLNMKKRNRKRD